MQKKLIFNKMIDGVKYLIVEINEDGEKYKNIISPNYPASPYVKEITYDENLKIFRLEDYINVLGRTIKIIFNLNTSLQLEGLIYNDIDSLYDIFTDKEFRIEKSSVDFSTLYQEYKEYLYNRLSEELLVREEKFNKDNDNLCRKRKK